MQMTETKKLILTKYVLTKTWEHSWQNVSNSVNICEHLGSTFSSYQITNLTNPVWQKMLNTSQTMLEPMQTRLHVVDGIMQKEW